MNTDSQPQEVPDLCATPAMEIVKTICGWVAKGFWNVIFPLMTLIFGPFLSVTMHYLYPDIDSVNLIWDPIYSFGWMFVEHGNRYGGVHSPMRLVALLLGLLVFCVVVVIGHKIDKSRIHPIVKWMLFFIIVGSFFVTVPWQDAKCIRYLHFFCFQIP